MGNFRLILRIGVWSPEVRRAQRIDEGFDQWSTSRRAIDFLLRAALGLHGLFFLPLHFFLALLERRFRGCHRISLNFAPQKHCRASGESTQGATSAVRAVVGRYRGNPRSRIARPPALRGLG